MEKRSRKVLPLFLGIFILLFSGSGCGNSNVQQRAWSLATTSSENTVTQIYAEKFAEEVASLSGGKMRIQVYANSELGNDREILKSCSDGDIPFVVQNTAPQAAFMPNLAVFDLPCVFYSLEDCRKKLDEPAFYDLISEVYTKGGYHLMGLADQGFRVMSSSKPVKAVSDFKGLKIRTTENPYHLAFWKSLEATPAPMRFAEVYASLEQDTIDAQESPYDVIASNKLYEQQDYIVETNHLPQLISLIVNDDFYMNLSEGEKFIMEEAAAAATEYARKTSDERISDRIDTIEKSGTKILTLDEDTREAIRSASQSVYGSIRSSISARIFDAYTDQYQ